MEYVKASESSVTARVYKKHNSVWYGIGRVVGVDLKFGIVHLVMETGRMKGKLGGFTLSTVKLNP